VGGPPCPLSPRPVADRDVRRYGIGLMPRPYERTSASVRARVADRDVRHYGIWLMPRPYGRTSASVRARVADRERLLKEPFAHRIAGPFQGRRTWPRGPAGLDGHARNNVPDPVIARSVATKQSLEAPAEIASLSLAMTGGAVVSIVSHYLVTDHKPWATIAKSTKGTDWLAYRIGQFLLEVTGITR